mgnify:CR=1 FL=1
MPVTGLVNPTRLLSRSLRGHCGVRFAVSAEFDTLVQASGDAISNYPVICCDGLLSPIFLVRRSIRLSKVFSGMPMACDPLTRSKPWLNQCVSQYISPSSGKSSRAQSPINPFIACSKVIPSGRSASLVRSSISL